MPEAQVDDRGRLSKGGLTLPGSTGLSALCSVMRICRLPAPHPYRAAAQLLRDRGVKAVQ